MRFLVIYCNDNMTVENVSQSALLNKFDFGNYYGNVVEFIRSAGIGDYLQLSKCAIVRTR